VSPKLKRLSGKEVLLILSKFGFSIYSQKGSHVKLRRTLSSGEIQTLTIPMHDELDLGTLRAIVRQAGRFIQEEQLRKEFIMSDKLLFTLIKRSRKNCYYSIHVS
jgi:predicted RNA binding protein YcfA (HicA-like mRNA interferase family)